MAAKKKNQPKRKPVPRHTRKYQFRNDHPTDQHVENILDFWKNGKQEITNLRKAVALYYALEQGDLSVLFDAFPQYKTQFAPSTAEALEQFMQILKQQQQPTVIGTGQSITYNPPIPLAAPPIAEAKPSLPVSDDALIENFLSMFQ
ncbi:MAG: hypothetical protein H0X30_01640 [Anaerolineae bacterium]|nr:hypothetical protein [Anaerolineae bacterium]